MSRALPAASTGRRPGAGAGFTLIELMIVVAVVVIVITLAAPSLRGLIEMQRLRALQSTLVTDLAFARSEAISRATFTQIRVQNGGGLSCYVIYARSSFGSSPTCDCTVGNPVNRCESGVTEIKTVQVAGSEGVSFSVPTGQSAFATFDPRTGGAIGLSSSEIVGIANFLVETQLDSTRRFRTSLAQSGRVQVCAPAGSTVGGPAC